ncbi:MAG TPA: hypothetical protein DCY37_02120 [Acidaminococcaceae bacterium]|nr:hypothetical protein [Acidaminococcaceae bacterium]
MTTVVNTNNTMVIVPNPIDRFRVVLKKFLKRHKKIPVWRNHTGIVLSMVETRRIELLTS